MLFIHQWRNNNDVIWLYRFSCIRWALGSEQYRIYCAVRYLYTYSRCCWCRVYCAYTTHTHRWTLDRAAQYLRHVSMKRGNVYVERPQRHNQQHTATVADDEEEEENISTTTTTTNQYRMRNVNVDNITYKSHQRLRRPTLWIHCSKVLQLSRFCLIHRKHIVSCISRDKFSRVSDAVLVAKHNSKELSALSVSIQFPFF